MLQLTPHSRILLAIEPVDCRNGIDSLATVCWQALAENPPSGALSVFRHRAGTALKRLMDDGQGYWRCTQRLSQGRVPSWPPAAGPHAARAARALAILLWNGHPPQAGMAADWQPVRSGGPSVAG